jgi:Lrp/AsnC family transcriptional regulator
MPLDQIDMNIIRCLQEDTMMPVAKVADHAGISPSPCWRRIQKLIADRVIRRRVALIDQAKVNVGVNVFVSIRTNQHSLEWASKFCRAAAQIPGSCGVLPNERKGGLSLACCGTQHRRL